MELLNKGQLRLSSRSGRLNGGSEAPNAESASDSIALTVRDNFVP